MSLRGGAAGSPVVLSAVPQLCCLLSLVVTRPKAARERELPLSTHAEDLGLRDDGACLKALGQHCGLIARVGANDGELVLVLLKSQPTAPSRPKLECSLQETGFWDNDCFVIDEDRASLTL